MTTEEKVEAILEAVCAAQGISRTELMSASRKPLFSDARRMAEQFMVYGLGFHHGEAARVFGRSVSNVQKGLGMFADVLDVDVDAGLRGRLANADAILVAKGVLPERIHRRDGPSGRAMARSEKNKLAA